MALPFEDDRFDVAVMALVIHFVPEPAKGIGELTRVVRPGGLVAAYVWDALGGACFLVMLATGALLLATTQFLPELVQEPCATGRSRLVRVASARRPWSR